MTQTLAKDDFTVSAAERVAVPANRFKLSGIDHVGLACRNPDTSGRFIEHILGGVEVYRAGYSEEDRALGRLRHIFYHVGAQLVEVVEQDDKKSYPDPKGTNTNPHWAFGATPENLVEFVAHLKKEKIPFNGPRSHHRTPVVSVYFRDMDGNNLEVTTWEGMPPELMATTPMGGQHGFIPWEKLSHNWPHHDAK